MPDLMFGHTLRMLRTAAGISLRTLAKNMDVSPAYLSQIELGKQPPPTHDRIRKMAETIGIPVSLLIEMSQRPNPDVIMLLRGNQDLNKLIKLIHDTGLERKDIVEIIALMQKLGREGFRDLVHYGKIHLSEFSKKGKTSAHIDPTPSSIDRKDLINWLNPRLVFKRLEFNEKSDLLLYMLEKIGIEYDLFDTDRAHKKLMSGETEESSGLGRGIAIPHLFVDELEQTVIAAARIPAGIDFSAFDKNPVYFVCLILSNPDAFQSHLNLLAYFARKFQLPTFLEDMLKATSKKDILSLLFDGNGSSIQAINS
jgi:mannitol/fructose-specific phosphotransferase system IIA component (Ntr-type)/DNA-binding XRE family transcriptional regulator